MPNQSFWKPSKKNGLALQFASEELRKCFDVIKAAIINNSDAIPYISKDYKKDKPYFELIRSLILGKSQSHILKYHDEKEFFKSDIILQKMKPPKKEGFVQPGRPMPTK